MKGKNYKRYVRPLSTVKEVECASPLLADSFRVTVQVDELENVNSTNSSSPEYFEFDF